MRYIFILAGFSLLTLPVSALENPKVNSFSKSHHLFTKETLGDQPVAQIAVHNVGNVWLTVSNIAQFGTGYMGPVPDPLTGTSAPSCIFPAGSSINYLYVGAFWIGAVVNRDTLVSIGVDDYYQVLEFWPDAGSPENIIRRSIQASSPFFADDAVSEQDIIAKYTDTVTDPGLVDIDPTDGRPHIPLNVEITQRSYAWSYDYAQDFILFDYSIKNIGRKALHQVYMGIYVDGDVHHTSVTGWEAYGEDLCGFKRTFPAKEGCGFLDTINLAYIMDNNGDPLNDNSWTVNSCRGLAGVRVVRTPSDSLSYSFNWWATDYNPGDDFGPRRSGTTDDPFRDMNGILGTPNGDRNKYYVMRHEEFDYDQMFTAVDHTSKGWLPRPPIAVDMADGYDARYLLSFGPFDITPGEVLPVTFAWICGDNVHVKADDFKNYFDPSFPQIYYDKLDFSDPANNSMWASWIYDNPGVATSGDSNSRGKYRICVLDTMLKFDTIQLDPLVIDTSLDTLRADTFWYQGDGIPDFRGASPPPPPEIRIYPRLNDFNVGELIVRWNGLASELTRDIFSHRLDFEGYRIYQSLTPNQANFVMISSFDKEDYNRRIWDNLRGRWILVDPPFTLDSLQKLYGEGFQPLEHGIDYPLHAVYPGGVDSTFYFTRQDWNTSNLNDTTRIHRLYPGQPSPSTLNLDSARIYYPEELTDEGKFKYFEYEYVIGNLLPSQLYYISVTAFDYGSPGHGLEAMETKPTANMVAEYPQNQTSLVEKKGLKVTVYPNPYKIDARYNTVAGGEFEGRGQPDASPERTRSIHFMNLPHKCTIRIFSIDGDLVREIKHDYPPDSPRSMHDTWDLITRNTQMIVSGIYFYSVESDEGNQIGKIVIIL